ncbi:MAG: ATP-binding cassette domain-containing protein [Promethearchaeota archaeon]
MSANKNFSNTDEMTKNDKITVENLYYIYKDLKLDIVALSGLSTEFHKGEVSLIMGPSGSGKTTLMNILAGILQPSSGNISFLGENVSNWTETHFREYRKKKITYILQSTTLFDFLTIKENFQFAFDLIGKKVEKNYFNNFLDRIDLKNRENYYPNEFSAGQIQKIAFLLALEKGSQIILADEPTGNLDAKSRDNFMEMINKMKPELKDSFMIIVSHDPALMKIADRLFILENGKCKTSQKLDKFSLKTTSKLSSISENEMNERRIQGKIQNTITGLKSLIKELESITK